MAHFLKGSFKGFYSAGPSACVKDIFRFRKINEGRILMVTTRRDQESLAGRFWRYENATINLIPVDEEQPRLGGKVEVRTMGFDFRTFKPVMKTQYGVYNDEFVTFGTFSTEAGSPLENEEVLLQIVEDSHPSIGDRTTFRFENNDVHFQRDVNSDLLDTEVHHPIENTRLDAVV